MGRFKYSWHNNIAVWVWGAVSLNRGLHALLHNLQR